MGLLKNVSLLAAGAAVGYLARRQATEKVQVTGLVRASSDRDLSIYFSHEGTMAQFFDSKYGKPFQSAALKTMQFIANVKAGMDEKEAEIQSRLEQQAKDPRPGSLDNWDQPALQSQPATRAERIARDRALGKDFFEA